MQSLRMTASLPTELLKCITMTTAEAFVVSLSHSCDGIGLQ